MCPEPRIDRLSRPGMAPTWCFLLHVHFLSLRSQQYHQLISAFFDTKPQNPFQTPLSIKQSWHVWWSLVTVPDRDQKLPVRHINFSDRKPKSRRYGENRPRSHREPKGMERDFGPKSLEFHHRMIQDLWPPQISGWIWLQPSPAAWEWVSHQWSPGWVTYTETLHSLSHHSRYRLLLLPKGLKESVCGPRRCLSSRVRPCISGGERCPGENVSRHLLFHWP